MHAKMSNALSKQTMDRNSIYRGTMHRLTRRVAEAWSDYVYGSAGEMPQDWKGASTVLCRAIEEIYYFWYEEVNRYAYSTPRECQRVFIAMYRVLLQRKHTNWRTLGVQAEDDRITVHIERMGRVGFFTENDREGTIDGETNSVEEYTSSDQSERDYEEADIQDPDA